MIFKLEYKKIIICLTIGFIGLVMLLSYKEESSNNVIPKKASYVFKKIEWGKYYV